MNDEGKDKVTGQNTPENGAVENGGNAQGQDGSPGVTQDTPQMPPDAGQGAPQADRAQEEKKGKKLPKPALIGIIIGAVAAACILLFVFVVSPMLQGTVTGDDTSNKNAVYLGEEGQIYALLENKSVKEFNEEAETAWIDRGGKFIAMIDGQDALSTIDISTGETKQVDEDVQDISALELSRYVVYTKGVETASIEELLEMVADEYWPLTAEDVRAIMEEDGEPVTAEELIALYEEVTGQTYKIDSIYYMYDTVSQETKEMFSSKDSEYNKGLSMQQSEKGQQFAYVNTAGEIILITKDGEEKSLAKAKKEKETVIEGVPDSGEMIVWSSQQPGAEDAEHVDADVYVFRNNMDDKICSVEDKSYFYCGVYYDASCQAALLSPDSEEIYHIDLGGKNDKIKADGNTVGTLYFNNSRIGAPNDLEHFYVTTETDLLENNLYAMDLEGERERIDTKVSGWQTRVVDNTVFYVDRDGNLYSCAVKDGKLQEKEKLASDVYLYQTSTDGKVVWVTKEADDDLFDLYMIKDGKAEKIDSMTDASYPKISEDGLTAAYVKDLSDIGGGTGKRGELYLYRNGASEKIASDVVSSSIRATHFGAYIDPADLPYAGNVYGEDGIVYGNLYLYNGKEATKLASDIICDAYPGAFATMPVTAEAAVEAAA